MTVLIRWTERAAEQLEDAAEHIESSREGFGDLFADELSAIVESIGRSPRRFPRVPTKMGEVRRALVSRFGYWVVFELEDTAAVILAVWHGRRTPEGWRDRER